MTDISSSQRLNIFLIDDSDGDAILMQRMMTRTLGENVTIHREATLDASLRALGNVKSDIVLLDLSLPDCSGFDGLRSIHNMAPHLPIIILTAYADEKMALEAVFNGAQDYLFKDKIDGATVLRSIQFAIQRKRFEEQLILSAHYDLLTGLANRGLFENRLDLALARRTRNLMGVAVAMIDLDGFKPVNDTYGHAVGDQLLKQVGARLQKTIRAYDTAARFGGDEFAVLIDGLKHADDCAVFAQNILKEFAEPFVVGAEELRVGASIGISCILGQENIDRPAMLLSADTAMYEVKHSGKGGYRVNGAA